MIIYISKILFVIGVPSPLVWKEYLKRFNDTKLNINFRDKVSGWKRYSLSVKGKNINYTKYHIEDIYMKGFLKNIILRDSCYNCQFKKYMRISDITLADFWGVDKICPEMFDNKGTSLVIVNSSKGEKLLSEIMKKTILTWRIGR